MTDATGYSTTFDLQRENGLVPYVGTVVNGGGTFSCDFTYTETGRFASENYHTPTGDSPVTFSYDENGNLLGDEGRSIIYDQCHFDENGYLLDTLGRDHPDGCTFIFQYDDEGHIVKVQQDWGGGTPGDITFSY